MALSFAKKLKERSQPNSLKFMLHNHLTGAQPGRPLKTVHASALTKPEGLCPRYYALHDVMKLKVKNEYLTTADELTYRTGREMQDAVVHWFADMGRCVGHWVCMACKHEHTFQKRPDKCVNCGCRAFKPEEVRFESAITGASCGVDMLVTMGDQKLVPVELKTMLKDQFKPLIAPLAEHKVRTNFYLRIIAESSHSWATLVDTKKAKVLYICKGGYCEDPDLGKWGLSDKYSPFKEYEITRDDSKTETYANRARVVKDFRDGKIGMPVGLCPTALFKRAQTCSVKKECWSGEHPPTHNWGDK